MHHEQMHSTQQSDARTSTAHFADLASFSRNLSTSHREAGLELILFADEKSRFHDQHGTRPRAVLLNSPRVSDYKKLDFRRFDS